MTELNNTDENRKSSTSHAPCRILVFSASLRRESLNSRLAKLAVDVIVRNGGVAQMANMEDFDCPSYNQDLEKEEYHPAGALEFRKRLLETDAFIIASPEYNGSMPGLIKNAIDWVSRFRPQPFSNRHALLLSASPSMAGGNRGLWSLRIPLESLGCHVYPSMFSLAAAHKAFDEEGNIADPQLRKRFEDNITAFVSLAEAAKNYPCMKEAWVAFLGEQPDPVTDRSE